MSSDLNKKRLVEAGKKFLDSFQTKNLQGVFVTVERLMANPQLFFEGALNPPPQASSLMLRYTSAIAGISSLVAAVILATIGTRTSELIWYRIGLLPALMSALYELGLTLASVYLGALLLQELSKRFGGSVPFEAGAALVAFTLTPTWFGRTLFVVPYLGLLGLLGGAYSLYLLWLGLDHVAGLPKEKKPIIFGVLGLGLGVMTVFFHQIVEGMRV